MSQAKIKNLSILILILFVQFPGLAVATGAGDQTENDSALKISQSAVGNRLGDYQLTNRDGTRLKLSELSGKPMVISLIYTSCYHICPTTTDHLASVVRKARKVLGDDSFSVLTIGFDTERDTIHAMRHFAAQHAVDMPGWYFLSTDKQTIKLISRDLGFIYTPSAMGFDHLIQASVIRADGRVYRQVYDMKFKTPMLVEPLKQLVYGEPDTDSVITHLGNRIRLFCTVYDPKSDRYVFDYSMFIGMFIGISTLSIFMFFIVREWRRNQAG